MRVCRCRGCCSLSVCVCDLFIFFYLIGGLPELRAEGDGGVVGTEDLGAEKERDYSHLLLV